MPEQSQRDAIVTAQDAALSNEGQLRDIQELIAKLEDVNPKLALPSRATILPETLNSVAIASQARDDDEARFRQEFGPELQHREELNTGASRLNTTGADTTPTAPIDMQIWNGNALMNTVAFPAEPFTIHVLRIVLLIEKLLLEEPGTSFMMMVEGTDAVADIPAGAESADLVDLVFDALEVGCIFLSGAYSGFFGHAASRLKRSMVSWS